MLRLLKARIDLSYIVNPFFLYCIGFSFAIAMYQLGWSNIFPPLSMGLILFFVATFIIFLFAGYFSGNNGTDLLKNKSAESYLKDIAFYCIIFLGLLNIIYMGYIPILDRTHKYTEFGMPVIDPLFNTLSIFFAIVYFRSFLDTRKKRLLVYILIILVIQLIIFRRATVVWISTSSLFIYLISRKIRIYILVLAIVSIPLISYCFGMYGNFRSQLNREYVLNDFGASESYLKKGLGYNHYITYLYISSPLANLQKNIDLRTSNVSDAGFKTFLFYCLVPESFTIRMEKSLHLSRPECYLITPNLIVGTVFMTAYYTLGWSGMIIMFLYLTFIILLCLRIIKKWPAFGLETFSILCTTGCLLIFSNFLNRLDVIIMLLVYPILFQLISETNLVRRGETL